MVEQSQKIIFCSSAVLDIDMAFIPVLRMKHTDRVRVIDETGESSVVFLARVAKVMNACLEMECSGIWGSG